MKEKSLTEEIFLKDVATHQIKILRDEGIYRHIQLRRPETNCYWFDVVTWPDHLCICGDMGTYVFTRITDMFNFFRRSPEKNNGLYINSGYWTEKCVAMDRHQQIEKYSPKLFRKRVIEWMDDGNFDDETRQAVEDEVLSRADDGEYPAMEAAMNFSQNGFSFNDFWEVDIKEYDYCYIWCLYAIVWTIDKYDEVKGINHVPPSE